MTISIPELHARSWFQREGKGKYYFEKQEDIKCRHLGESSDIETEEVS